MPSSPIRPRAMPSSAVMVAKTSGGVRVAVTGAGAGVFRDQAIEQALSASFAADAVGGSGADEGDLNSDIHASAG